MIKKLIISIVFLGVLYMESSSQELGVKNLMLLMRQGVKMPDGSQQENNLSINFQIESAEKADRVKVVVRQRSNGELLEVRTIRLQERDGVLFYSDQGFIHRMKRDVIPLKVSIGNLSQQEVEVEVFAVDKQNKITEKVTK